jgi:hypothetical protein
MRVKSLLSAGLGALALGLVATSAQAAPMGGNLTAAVERGTGDSGLVQKVHRYYGYGDYYYRPYRYDYYQPYYYGYYRPYYYRPYHYYRPYYRHRYHYRHW